MEKLPEKENRWLELLELQSAYMAARYTELDRRYTELVTRLVFELGGQIELDYCNDINERWGLTASLDEVNRTLKLRLVEKVQEHRGEDR